MKAAIVLFLAYLLDRIVGDPRFLTHPVVLMGRVIQWLEAVIRRLVSGDRSLRFVGLLFPLILAGGSYGLVWLLLRSLSEIHPWLALAAEIWLISTTIAAKGLADAGMEIYALLLAG
ncbi:cobalamin biosynthesis protein [Microbacteriaceae bacterium K1510]|nr:cobalamin biosynthesis protein [Microbacteriaceae bacterium K1510]